MRDTLEGRSEEEVLSELSKFLSMDVPYSRVLSSMCTNPHPIAVKAHCMFVRSNLGDPGLFPGTAEVERKLISILAGFFGDENARGYVTSGGTEGNIQAMRAARNVSGIRNGNVVVPESAHFSFLKVGDLLGLEIRKAKLDEDYRVDLGEVERLIDDRTIALVGIAGTTELGQVDDIRSLSKIAEERGIFLHVDAAFGGFVLPFLGIKDFDFRVKGVCSLTADPHKMCMATIPSGVLLFRREEYLRSLDIETPYLTSAKQCTLTGTRPGSGAVSAYAVIRHLGFEGLGRIVRECMRVTRLLKEELESYLTPVIEPVTNVVCFRCRAEKLKAELLKEGWYVSTIRRPEAIRCVIMPHVTESVALEFASCVKRVLSSSPSSFV